MHRLPKILIIEDSVDILMLLKHQLESRGFQVAIALNGPDALKELLTFWPDIVLCDVLMPGMDGFQVAREIKSRTNIPLIFLTGLDDPEHKATALQSLVDDYIVKPCDPRELFARIERVLRYSGLQAHDQGILAIDSHVAVDFDKSAVQVSNETIHLTSAEMRILYHLAQNAGKPVATDDLLRLLWPMLTSKEMLPKIIHSLRLKLEPEPGSPRYILNSRGDGYLLVTSHTKPPVLTRQQMEILRLVARGHTDNEIAIEIGFSSRTIGDHITQIRQILGAESRPHAIALAMSCGLLTSTDVQPRASEGPTE